MSERIFVADHQSRSHWKLLTSNPLDAVKPPRVAKTEVNFLDKAETAVLLNFLEEKADHPIILLAVTTAMRRGEVLGLRWCDVHLDAKDKKGKPDPHLRVTQNMTCV